MNAQGIDVSSWQNRIYWRDVVTQTIDGAPLDFAIARATIGEHGKDSEWDRNWGGIGDAGLARGAYHAADLTTPACPQARAFAAALRAGGYEPKVGMLRPVVDVERVPNRQTPRPAAVVAWVEAFVAELELELGIAPMIYTGGFWRFDLGNPPSEVAGRCPLWLADYEHVPHVPAPWARWSIWQVSGDVAAPGGKPLRLRGIAGNVDRDMFDGDRAALDALCVPSTAPPADPAIILTADQAPAHTIADEVHDNLDAG